MNGEEKRLEGLTLEEDDGKENTDRESDSSLNDNVSELRRKREESKLLLKVVPSAGKVEERTQASNCGEGNGRRRFSSHLLLALLRSGCSGLTFLATMSSDEMGEEAEGAAAMLREKEEKGWKRKERLGLVGGQPREGSRAEVVRALRKKRCRRKKTGDRKNTIRFDTTSLLLL